MSFEGARPGAAWSSSARVVRCSVQSGNERNPCEVLYMSLQTALSFAHKAQMNLQPITNNLQRKNFWKDFSSVVGYQLLVVSLFALRTSEREEGGDDVRSAWPFDTLGDTRATMAGNKGSPTSDGEPIPKTRSQFGLQAATRLHEAGIASNRWSATQRWMRSRILYSPPVTPRELAIPEGPVLNRGRR